MLLTVHFEKTGTKPLSIKEWARFARWLRDHKLNPSQLLKKDPKSLLSDWKDKEVTLERVEGLLDRGVALGFALYEWQQAGLWIITRSESDYPDRLKRKLRFESPPVLFGCGGKMLLNKGGIAVVGSRDADEDDLDFSSNLARTAADQGLSVVSGAARGVDESAMIGALEHEGTAVGVVANSLLHAVTSKKYRKHLFANDLVLISPFNPEAGFNVGNAMARNKYIYCLSDAAVVVNSTLKKGGTWNGAIEDLKKKWVPLLVKPKDSPKSVTRRSSRWARASSRRTCRHSRLCGTFTLARKRRVNHNCPYFPPRRRARRLKPTLHARQSLLREERRSPLRSPSLTESRRKFRPFSTISFFYTFCS